MLKKVDNILYKTLCYICAILMFGMMLLIATNVFFRYVLNNSIPWSEEAGRFMFIWMSFLGAVAAYHSHSHVALDLLLMKTKGMVLKIIRILTEIFALAMAIGMILGGNAMVTIGLMQTSPSLRIPMQYMFSVFPISGVLLFYFAIRKIATHVGLDQTQEGVNHG